MKRLGFTVLLGLALAGFGCKTHVNPGDTSGRAAPGNAAITKEEVPPTLSPLDEKAARQRVEALARYATGITYELNEKGDDALEEFYQSVLANSSNEPLVIELASRLAQKNQHSRAIEILEKSANRPNATGLVFAMLARVNLQTGKTNTALAAAQNAVKRSPEQLSGYEALSSVYAAMEKPQESLRTLDRAAGQIKSEASMLIGLTDLYANYSKLHPKEKESIAPRARELLNRAAKLQPKNILMQQKLADDFAYFGEPKRAADIYLKLLANEDNEELDVWRDLMREKLANIFLLQNDKTNAVTQLEEIIRDNPTKYPQAYYILGSIAYDQKNFKRAAECFEKTMLLSPELEQVYYDLAGTQINLDQPNRALALLDKARGKFKETFVNEFFSAIACNKLKKFDEALKHYTAAEIIAQASSTNRLDHTFYFQVGACYERLKNFTDAEKYFEKALEKSPNDPETLNYLGYMWADRGTNLTKAKQLIEKAIKLEPKNAAFMDSMGWVLFKMQQAQDALPYILKAIELSEEPDAAVYDHLGDIYKLLKQPDKAQEAWKKSLSIESNDEIKKKLDHTL